MHALFIRLTLILCSIVALLGCKQSRVVCGPGTVLVGRTCLVADAGPTSDGPPPYRDRGTPPIDAPHPDAATPDAAMISCGSGDISVCDGLDIVSCGSGARAPCRTPEACHVLEWRTGPREAFCAPAGVTPCDPNAFVTRCDGQTLSSCLLTVGPDGAPRPGWVIETDCVIAGPDGACVESPQPHCQSAPCDDNFVEACTSDGRGTRCDGGRVLYWSCGASYRCAVDRVGSGLVCVGLGAVPSDRGSARPETIGCVDTTTARVQRHGYEWTAACEPTVVFIAGSPASVPTYCTTRDGLAACIPEAAYRTRCSDAGWSCDVASSASYCDGATVETFPCGANCDHQTGRCIPPSECDPSAPTGECTEPGIAALCFDEDGDGRGYITPRACPVECSEEPSFVCR